MTHNFHRSVQFLVRNPVTEEELKRAFFLLKTNKTPSYDNINVNVVKKKIEKDGEKDLLTNYWPISVLPCFSKILERIMYDRLIVILLKQNTY